LDSYDSNDPLARTTPRINRRNVGKKKAKITLGYLETLDPSLVEAIRELSETLGYALDED